MIRNLSDPDLSWERKGAEFTEESPNVPDSFLE